MAGFVKMATLGELPPGGAKEVEHDGRISYFCCPACKRAFAEVPGRYLASAG